MPHTIRLPQHTYRTNETNSYISSLDDKLDVVSESQLLLSFSFRVMKEYFLNNICSFNESKIFLHRTDNTMVLHRMYGILETYVTSAQGSPKTKGKIEYLDYIFINWEYILINEQTIKKARTFGW